MTGCQQSHTYNPNPNCEQNYVLIVQFQLSFEISLKVRITQSFGSVV